MDRDEQAAMWCMNHANGDLSAEEQEVFALWMNDPANAEALRLQASIWNLTAFSASKPEFVRMRREALDDYHRANARRWREAEPPPPGRRYARWGIAATILVAIVSVVAWQYGLPGSRTGDRPGTELALAEYRTGRGERSVAALEDGSRLSLDAATQVNVKMTGARREVTLLEGRAGFTVVKAERPFAVTAGDKTVVATGTSFSVERLGNAVNINLYEGSVIVLDRSTGRDKAIAALKPGEALTLPAFGEAGKVPVRSQVPSMQSWEAGQLEFVDEPLASAIARINRYAARPVTVAENVPAGIRITGLFDAADTEGFAEGVASLHGLNVERSAGELMIARKP